ncbi:hypothetical protein M434DRAFT_17407 [Hypoxylon sp. CO27-5]|nr:hypothetical protein M434DRAFT_17407 [Hypoxylon sp. CO27-5]
MPESTMFRFTCLPAELRIIVWEFCLPGPRNVTVMKGKHTPAPVILHVCFESRAEAQRKSYELAFPVAIKPARRGFIMGPDIQFESTPVIWFNYKLDRLCLDSSWVDFQSCPGSFRRLRSLGLSYRCNAYCGDGIIGMFYRSIWEDVAFSGLKEVVLFGPRHDVADVHLLATVPSPPLTSDDDLLVCRLLGSRIRAILNNNMPPIRWHLTNFVGDCFSGPRSAPSSEAVYNYVFICAVTGEVEVQELDQEQLGWEIEENGQGPRSKGCPEHP